jgi:hypothetical protein
MPHADISWTEIRTFELVICSKKFIHQEQRKNPLSAIDPMCFIVAAFSTCYVADGRSSESSFGSSANVCLRAVLPTVALLESGAGRVLGNNNPVDEFVEFHFGTPDLPWSEPNSRLRVGDIDVTLRIFWRSAKIGWSTTIWSDILAHVSGSTIARTSLKKSKGIKSGRPEIPMQMAPSRAAGSDAKNGDSPAAIQ